MKNIEKGREVEQRMKDHIAKYPLTEEEAFDVTEENEIPDVENEGKVTNELPPFDSIITTTVYDDGKVDPYVDPMLDGDYKLIDFDTYAYEIPTLGCFVRGDSGFVFIPQAAIKENSDGSFDLIRGRKFNG